MTDHVRLTPRQLHDSNVQALDSSVETFGWFDGVIVHKGRLIAGHNRLRRAQQDDEEGLPGYDLSAYELADAQIMAMAIATVLGVGYLIPMIYLIWSMRYGQRADDNPWGAVGLEWETSSPPPTLNFDETPVVEHEAYEYTQSGTRVA